MKRVSKTDKNVAEALRRCPLFQDLEREDRELLVESGELRDYEAGEYFCFQGDPARGFFAILSGSVRLQRLGTDGREQLLKIAEAGDVFAEAALFSGGDYPATALAGTAARALFISKRAFLEAGRRRPELLLALLGVMSRRLRRFVRLIDDLSLKETPARLAGRLLELRDKSGGDAVELETTKAVLAARLGTIPETLSRILRRMRNQGLIETEGKRIRLKDVARLKNIAEGEKF